MPDETQQQIRDKILHQFNLTSKKEKEHHNFCKLHPNTELDFYCGITEDFYCMHCAMGHSNHQPDKPLVYFQNELQNTLTELKLMYMKKRIFFMDRVI